MPTAMRAVLLNLELPKSDSIVPWLIEPLRVNEQNIAPEMRVFPC
jgi:hypothetical protein